MTTLVLTTSYPLGLGSVSGSFVREVLHGLAPLGFRFEVVTPAGAPGTDRAGGPAATLEVDGGGAVVAEGLPARSATGIAVRAARYPGWRFRSGLAHARGIPDTLATEPWKWALVPGLVGALWRAAEARIEEGGIELVWSHWMIPCGVLGAALAKRHRIPHLATAHGADVCWLERATRVPGARRALAALWSRSALVAPAARTARRVAAALGCSDVGVLPLPSSLAASEPAAGTPRLLFLGRFEPIKGPDLLLEALAALPGGLYAGVTLAGGGHLEPALRQRSATLATPVRFPGVVGGEEKREALAAAHAVVLPSRRLADGRAEGLPHAAIEALAAGRPVVAPREGALADLVAETGAGVLYDAPTRDSGRVRALADALRALAEAPGRLRDLAARARAAGEAFRAPGSLAPWSVRLKAAAERRA